MLQKYETFWTTFQIVSATPQGRLHNCYALVKLITLIELEIYQTCKYKHATCLKSKCVAQICN